MVLSLREQFKTITQKNEPNKMTKSFEAFTNSKASKSAEAQIKRELGRESFKKTRTGTTKSKQRNIEQEIRNELEEFTTDGSIGMENYEHFDDEEPEMSNFDEVEAFEDIPSTMEKMKKEASEGEEAFRHRRGRRRRRRRRRRHRCGQRR